MAQDYPGLTEYGLSLNDFKNEQGDIQVAVDAATLDQETAIWVAGNASISQESLSEAQQMQMATSGNAAWKDNMGLVQMMSPKDVGKKIWIRVRDEQRRWAGPFSVIKAVDPERWYQWKKEDKVIEVSPEVGHQMNIGDKKTPVEVFWGNEPPADNMGEATHQGVPVLGFDLGGGMPAMMSGNIPPNRSPGLAQMPPGASMGFMQASTGMSQGSIRDELGGATDMRIGNDPIGAAIAGVQEARAGWVTNQVNPTLRMNSGKFDWDQSMGSPYEYQGDQGGQGGQGGQGPISYPDNVFFASYEEGVTGDVNMLYELQMAGMPQSAIKQYAQENGIGFEEAVRALHAQAAVEERWPTMSPWFVHMSESEVFGWEWDPELGENVKKAGNIADAARILGIDIDNIPLDELMYSTEAKGGEFGEGSWEHYVHDHDVIGWTQLSFEDWTKERLVLDYEWNKKYWGEEEGLWSESVPIDERLLEALNPQIDPETGELVFDNVGATFPDSSGLPEAQAESTSTSSTSTATWTDKHGPARAVISEYEEGGILFPEPVQAPVDTQATVSKYEEWQQEIANTHGFWGPDAYANWLMSDDTEEDEGDFTESVQAMEDFYGGVGGGDPTTTWGQEEREKAEPVQKDPVSKGQKKKLTDFERAEKYGVGGADPTTTWGW